MDTLKKIDWVGLGLTLLAGAGGAILLRTVEAAWPKVEVVTRSPEKVVQFIKR